MGVIIRAERVSFSYLRPNGTELQVLQDLDLEIEEGSFVTIVGPSGCGKSTLLNLVAGLLFPSSGAIYYRDAQIQGPRPEIGYMTQKDTLMPWRTILTNVEMPLELRGVDRELRRQRAQELLQLVGLAGFAHHYPRQLSGGMLRRASLARTLCAEPETLLMDEPFGAIDAQLRLELQNELLRLWSGSGKTVIFVTHDIEEAIALADRVIVFGLPGRIIHDEQITLPRPRDAVKIRFSPAFAAIHERVWNAVMTARRRQGGTE